MGNAFSICIAAIATMTVGTALMRPTVATLQQPALTEAVLSNVTVGKNALMAKTKPTVWTATS